jgi:hypothetical protein
VILPGHPSAQHIKHAEVVKRVSADLQDVSWSVATPTPHLKPGHVHHALPVSGPCSGRSTAPSRPAQAPIRWWQHHQPFKTSSDCAACPTLPGVCCLQPCLFGSRVSL